MEVLLLFWLAAACIPSQRLIFAAFQPTQSENDCGHRIGEAYIICPQQMRDFHEDGLAVLFDIITEEEIGPIEEVYSQYMAEGSPEIQGKDFCDMSKPFDTPRDDYSVINAMLPSRYYPQLKGNIYERVAASIAAQLYPDVDMVFDYDQLLDKRPRAGDAVFAWHQDMAYWPPPSMTPDTRTVTFSLALDNTTKDNGCIRYLPQSGMSRTVRPHIAMAAERKEAHAIGARVEDHEVVQYAEVPRLSVSVHNEYVVHGSGGNLSSGPRRTYVIAFRPADTVRRERAAGFSHSHNDDVNWDKFNQWGTERLESGSGESSESTESANTTSPQSLLIRSAEGEKEEKEEL